MRYKILAGQQGQHFVQGSEDLDHLKLRSGARMWMWVDSMLTGKLACNAVMLRLIDGKTGEILFNATLVRGQHTIKWHKN